MKKFLGIALAVVVLTGAAISGVLLDRAEAATPYAQTPVIARHFESLGVAAGAAIATTVLDLSNVSECIAYADNSAGGATRALNSDCIGADGTTIVFRVANTVGIAGRGATAWGSSVAAAAVPSGMAVVPAGTCKKMQFTLAAGGAAAGSLAVDCR